MDVIDLLWVIISLYIYIKPLRCTPKTTTTLHDNYRSVFKKCKSSNPYPRPTESGPLGMGTSNLRVLQALQVIFMHTKI